MGQKKKEHIKKTIMETALRMFATSGYKDTTIADIAKEAKVSVGNIYRYYDSKNKLLEDILPETFVSTLRDMLYQKITTGKTSNLRRQSEASSYLNYSQGFHTFILENKLRLIILLRHPDDTPYESFKENIVESWVQFVLEQFVQDKALWEMKRCTLSVVFSGFMELNMMVLTKNWSNEKTLEELKQINRYHIIGLTALLEN